MVKICVEQQVALKTPYVATVGLHDAPPPVEGHAAGCL